MNSTKNQDLQFHRKAAVLGITGLSHSSLYRLMASGDFPRPYQLSGKSVAWRSDEVYRWFETRNIATTEQK